MYIAMNRFKVKKESMQAFEELWKTRESRLNELPGFRGFSLVKSDCKTSDDWTLYATHVIWDSKNDFLFWTKSQQFCDAHKNAGSSQSLMAGPPQFEGFEAVFTL